MVSFQSPNLKLNQTKSILALDKNPKKRKWDHYPEADENSSPSKKWMNFKSLTTAANLFYDIELHLETPLPSGWQRCLDIQSGEIYYYNTRTQKTTVRDPREDHGNRHDMNLDLELNLPCGSLNRNSSSKTSKQTTQSKSSSKTTASTEDDDDHKKGFSDESKGNEATEMVAAACMRCHMLVVLQKASPTCPNCKFLHPTVLHPYSPIKAA